MTIGNYSKKVNYFNGIEIGYTEQSDDIPLTHNCFGATYDGKTIGRISTNLHSNKVPDVHITNITDDEYTFDTHGYGTLKDWKTIFLALIIHINTLQNTN